jgi:hypothetical protein
MSFIIIFGQVERLFIMLLINLLALFALDSVRFVMNFDILARNVVKDVNSSHFNCNKKLL